MPVIKFVQFVLDDKNWIGVYVTLPDSPISILAAFCVDTGKSFQLTLPGF